MSDSVDSEEWYVEDMLDCVTTLTEDECPSWIANRYCFPTIPHLLKYGQRGPHTLATDKAKFRCVFETNEVVRLRLRFREKRRPYYVKAVGEDIVKYIEKEFGRSAVYDRGYVYVLPREFCS